MQCYTDGNYYIRDNMVPLLLLLALQAVRWLGDEASASAAASAFADSLASSCVGEFNCVSCSQVQFCRSGPTGLREAYRVTCGGATPYCDRESGACVETAPKGCAEVGIFTCMRDGVFPDPGDCKAYHVCEKGVSHTFKCSAGHYFNGTGCEKSSYCRAAISCSGKSGVKVVHPYVKNIFAYCLKNKVLFVDKCEDNNIMDGVTQKCRPECRSGLKLPDSGDPAKYFLCSPNNSYPTVTYELVPERCPPRTRFDPDSQDCCKPCPSPRWRSVGQSRCCCGSTTVYDKPAIL